MSNAKWEGQYRIGVLVRRHEVQRLQLKQGKQQMMNVVDGKWRKRYEKNAYSKTLLNLEYPQFCAVVNVCDVIVLCHLHLPFIWRNGQGEMWSSFLCWLLEC